MPKMSATSLTIHHCQNSLYLKYRLICNLLSRLVCQKTFCSKIGRKCIVYILQSGYIVMVSDKLSLQNCTSFYKLKIEGSDLFNEALNY
jgi:hypothetical protein